MAAEPCIRITEDVNVRNGACLQNSKAKVVDLLAALRSATCNQDVADSHSRKHGVSFVVLRFDYEPNGIMRVVLLEKRLDVLFEFMINTLAWAENKNGILARCARPESPNVSAGTDAFDKAK